MGSAREPDLAMRLLIAELARVAELAELATNLAEGARELEPVTLRHDVAHPLLD